MRRTTGKWIRALLAVFSLLVLCTANVNAQSFLDPDKDVTLSVRVQDNGQAIKGMTFHLYKIADSDESQNLTSTADFSRYGLTYGGKSEQEYRDMAVTLLSFVERDHIRPVESLTCGADGWLRFGTGSVKLKPGLYLLTADAYSEEEATWKSGPSLILLPYSEDMRNTWLYDREVKPKIERTDHPKVFDLKVIKIWADKGNEKNRPTEITVHLYKDGNKVESVKLNSASSWRHTWTGLSQKNTWTISEEAVGSYKTTITGSGASYTITNTYETPGTPGRPYTPNTGQTWWPVPLLMAAGAILIIKGRKDKE